MVSIVTPMAQASEESSLSVTVKSLQFYYIAENIVPIVLGTLKLCYLNFVSVMWGNSPEQCLSLSLIAYFYAKYLMFYGISAHSVYWNMQWV